jgi:hypothetical protein
MAETDYYIERADAILRDGSTDCERLEGIGWALVAIACALRDLRQPGEPE